MKGNVVNLILFLALAALVASALIHTVRGDWPHSDKDDVPTIIVP